MVSSANGVTFVSFLRFTYRPMSDLISYICLTVFLLFILLIETDNFSEALFQMLSTSPATCPSLVNTGYYLGSPVQCSLVVTTSSLGTASTVEMQNNICVFHCPTFGLSLYLQHMAANSEHI